MGALTRMASRKPLPPSHPLPVLDTRRRLIVPVHDDLAGYGPRLDDGVGDSVGGPEPAHDLEPCVVEEEGLAAEGAVACVDVESPT